MIQLWKVISGGPLTDSKSMGLEHVGTFEKLPLLKKFLKSDQIIKDANITKNTQFIILTTKNIVLFKTTQFYTIQDLINASTSPK